MADTSITPPSMYALESIGPIIPILPEGALTDPSGVVITDPSGNIIVAPEA